MHNYACAKQTKSRMRKELTFRRTRIDRRREMAAVKPKPMSASSLLWAGYDVQVVTMTIDPANVYHVLYTSERFIIIMLVY